MSGSASRCVEAPHCTRLARAARSTWGVRPCPGMAISDWPSPSGWAACSGPRLRAGLPATRGGLYRYAMRSLYEKTEWSDDPCFLTRGTHVPRSAAGGSRDGAACGKPVHTLWVCPVPFGSLTDNPGRSHEWASTQACV